VSYPGRVTERVELDIDPGTAAFLRSRAGRGDGSLGAAAVRELRRLAMADSADRTFRWFAEHHPTFFEDAEAERIAAGLY
jgi:hypothetical protein